MSLPTKEGHLFKYKHFPKKWEYRYFKLNKTYLQFYETQHSLNPKGSILRTDIISAEPSTAFSDRVYVFTITSNDKWHVSAAGESEMQDWIRVLRAHLPPSLATGSTKASKVAKGDDEESSSPTVTAPPLPGYMAAQMASDQLPTYEDACLTNKVDLAS